MKKWLLGLVAVLAALTVMGSTAEASQAPRSPQAFNTGKKYGHYKRYTKRLPKSLRGNWYARTTKKHLYYDQLNFKSYKTIKETLEVKSHLYYINNILSKSPQGMKLYSNGHWFSVQGIADYGSYRVKTLKVDHKRQPVLMFYTQGHTTYYLRHKSKQMHIYNRMPANWNLTGMN